MFVCYQSGYLLSNTKVFILARSKHSERQTIRQTQRQTDGWINRQRDKITDKKDRQIEENRQKKDRQTNNQSNR